MDYKIQNIVIQIIHLIVYTSHTCALVYTMYNVRYTCSPSEGPSEHLAVHALPQADYGVGDCGPDVRPHHHVDGRH